MLFATFTVRVVIDEKLFTAAGLRKPILASLLSEKLNQTLTNELIRVIYYARGISTVKGQGNFYDSGIRGKTI